MKALKQKKSVLAVDISGKPTVISLFAGTGGSSLGYHWAGYRELLAVDFDSHAVECFKLNFPDVPIWKKSVTEITGKEILEFCSIGVGELDVLDGSPPCQGFSMAGKRDVLDPRNDLFKHYMRLINELQPKVFVMENVSGMVKGKMKGRFIEIMRALKETGYAVKCKLMNAANYSVPQSRERLIFIGVRRDLNKDPVFPMAVSKKETFYTAAGGLGDVGFTPKVHPFCEKYVPMLKQGESIAKYHPKKAAFGFYRVKMHAPMRTLLKQFQNQYYHPVENRCLGINELKAMCTFPLDWRLGDSYALAVARLGNAVMPKFMQAIAENIKINILGSSGDA